MSGVRENTKHFLASRCAAAALVCLISHVIPARAGGENEHFLRGTFRGSIQWDSISAVETGIYRFGGSAAWFVLDGLAMGYEQQFVLPRNGSLASLSWGFVRLVPFRDWPVAPFLSARLGYLYLPNTGAIASGVGCGFALFVSENIAFETIFRAQLVFHSVSVEHQNEVETNFAIYF